MILKLKAFKVTISKNWIRFFSFFLKNRKSNKKIYYATPFLFEWRNFYIKEKKYVTKSGFASLRVTRLFYIIYTYRQLKQKAKKAKKMDGIFEQNYILLIECKLPAYIYRTSLVPNMFDSINIVKKGNVWINKYFYPYVHYVVKPMDLVGFRVLQKSYIYWQFYKRLKRKAFLFLFPSYIYISFCFLFTLLLRVPLNKELINAFSVDLYRVANYAV